MTMKTRASRVLVIAGAFVVLSAGFAYAAIPGTDAAINGCYEKYTGLLRVIDAEAGKKCTRFETPISWSQQYLAGEGLALTGNVFSVAEGSLNAEDFSTVDEEGLTSENIKNESLSGEDLDNGSVATADVADESLTGEDLDNGSVATADVADESLRSEDLDNGSVAASEVANESLTSEELDNGSVAASEVANESLTSADLANGSVATMDIRANAVMNAVDYTGPQGLGDGRELTDPNPAGGGLEPVVSATINLPTGGQSGPQADHRLLVTGQALVECRSSCAQGNSPFRTVAWQLREPAPDPFEAGQALGPVYRAKLPAASTFTASISRVLTRSDPGFNEHTIELVMWILDPPGPLPSPEVDVTQANLSLIDLGSV
jgi:hypothetical protein